jgi:tetratricopeptide (TPR) repeat protein
MQRRCVWSFFLLLSFLAPTVCFGQAGSYVVKKALSGYVREEGSGHVIAAVRVELQNAMGTPVAFTYTDGNGAFEFNDMGGGDCYVVAQRDGYSPTREFVRPDGSPHVYKDVYLRPASGGSAPAAVSPVSEHQLSIPPKARELFDKGVKLVVEKSDYRGAVSQFSHAIEKYPTYYEAYAAMGLAQYKMGDAATAETSLRKSIDLSSETYAQPMLDLASMLNGLKRFPDAEPVLRKAITLDPSSWRGQYELAVSLSGENRFRDAVASASAARSLKPDNPQICLLLYNLHIETDDFSSALADADDYLKLAPDGAMANRVRKMREQLAKDLRSSGISAARPPSLF